jgi:hypothetical protein
MVIVAAPIIPNQPSAAPSASSHKPTTAQPLQSSAALPTSSFIAASGIRNLAAGGTSHIITARGVNSIVLDRSVACAGAH